MRKNIFAVCMTVVFMLSSAFTAFADVGSSSSAINFRPITVSNQKEMKEMTLEEAASTLLLSDEQKPLFDNSLEDTVYVYYCDSPVRIELTGGGLSFFRVYYNEDTSRRESIEFHEVLDEEMLQYDAKVISAGTYFALSDPGVYIVSHILRAMDMPVLTVVIIGGDAPTSAPAPAPAPALAANDTVVLFNGNKLDFTMPIINNNGRTFYPMRELFEALGAEVSWNDETKTAGGALNGNVVEFTIDSNTYMVNGSSKTMDTTAFVKDGRTYVPIRFAAEGLGMNVEWEAETGSIIIK